MPLFPHSETGTRAASSWHPESPSCDTAATIRNGGGGGEGDGLKRGTVANHYVNQHQQRQSHQFRSTDRLLDSSPASPSIHAGHHQCHLQHQQQDLLQQEQERFLPSSNPRPRGSIVTATAAATGLSPAKYVLRTLSSTPPEFFDHHHHSNFPGYGSEETAVLNTGSLQRNRLMNPSDRVRRSSASPSLISSLISSFTSSHHHLRDRNQQPLNHWSAELFDPTSSLEMMERRGGGGGSRVVTFDLPPPSSGSQSSSKSSLLCLDRHHQPNASLRRYSLTGGSLLPASSSTSCLIFDSSIPAASVESNLQNHAAVIGSSLSHHHLARADQRVGMQQQAGSYATLRLCGRKATASPFLHNDHHQQRNLYQVDHDRAFTRDGHCQMNGSSGKVLLDQHFVQRSGSFIDDKRQRKLITNSETANPILLSNSIMSSSSRCNVPSWQTSPIYGSSSKAPECTHNPAANGLLMHAGAGFDARDHLPEKRGQTHAFTSPAASSSSSSGGVQDTTHNNRSGSACHPRHQMQQQPNRIKYSPDEGLGDERSEFEVAAAGGGGGGGGDAATAAASGDAITA